MKRLTRYDGGSYPGRVRILRDKSRRAFLNSCRIVNCRGNVRDDFDCLYYHLRETPVLFTGNSSDGTKVQVAGKKRKADEALGACD